MRGDLTFAAATHRGLVRSKNEDAYAIIDDDSLPCALILADGMGGHRKGELASRLAVDYIEKHLRKDLPRAEEPDQVMQLLVEIIEKANVKVYLGSLEEETNHGMGTTLTTAVFLPENLILAHVGDCRAYLLREGVLIQLTEDHTLVQEMLAAGSLTPDESVQHPRRNVLTRALGVPEYVQPDQFNLPLKSGDRILLCSDGLHGHVPDSVIESCMKKNKKPEHLVQQLIDQALQTGGDDNITVMTAFG